MNTSHRAVAGVLLPLVAAVMFAAPRGLADVKLPALFSDHMALERDAAVRVWGWAEPGEQVTVSIADQTKTATAGADGKWTLKLDKLATGDPLTLTVKATNTITINDVLVG